MVLQNFANYVNLHTDLIALHLLHYSSLFVLFFFRWLLGNIKLAIVGRHAFDSTLGFGSPDPVLHFSHTSVYFIQGILCYTTPFITLSN